MPIEDVDDGTMDALVVVEKKERGRPKLSPAAIAVKLVSIVALAPAAAAAAEVLLIFRPKAAKRAECGGGNKGLVHRGRSASLARPSSTGEQKGRSACPK